MTNENPLSPAISDELARIGPKWASNVSGHVQRMVDLYSPLLATAPKDGVEVTTNLRYGASERHVLDIFAPKDAHLLPIVLFVHGGAFVAGNRNRSAEVYANVLYYFSRHGFIGVNMEYRLAPEATFPGGSDDVAAACEWLGNHAAEFGGDPTKLFVMGHSAGGAHAATYVLDPQYAGARAPGLRGLMVVSGRVRADASAENPNAAKVRAYYGDDQEKYNTRSPVEYSGASNTPVFIAFAEYENPLIDVYCLELAYRTARIQRRAPDVIRLLKHNHTSIIAHINTEEDELGQRMRSFIQRCLHTTA